MTAEGPMRPLDRLASRLGIEEQFRDAGGTLRRPPADVKRRLLAAMGVRVKRAADAEAALVELDRAEWAEPLAPAVVPESALPAAVPLTLAAGTDEVRWTIDEEGGDVHGGRARFTDLELLDAHEQRERRQLVLEPKLPLGYHRLSIEADPPAGRPASAGAALKADTPLIVVPERCYVPPRLAHGERAWGLIVQLYMLRSERNWGVGDFTDLERVARVAGRLGASVIGLNPLHAPVLDEAGTPSPYSPASRLFLNPLYIDVTAVPELARSADARATIESPDFAARLSACREAELIDHAEIARLKLPVLEQLQRTFDAAASQDRRAAFDAFRQARGDELERFCCWQALREHFTRRDPALGDWHRWPREYRDARSPAVARFAARHRARILFFEWLQWIADAQLEAAAATAQEAGLALGLYRDLTVGADNAGAEAWSDAPLFADGASAGAPADLFNPAGQDWGLPPLDPHALRRHGFSTFIELIRANMRHAGGLRIDHAMGLQHLYWVARGRPPSDGAYISYPLDELVGIVALESRRQRCIVVGEDLGTVPSGFRERMHERAIFSNRIVFFEQDEEGRLIAPEAYPSLALAAIGSHDLAPLRGWWEGRDIELKRDNDLYPDEATYHGQLERRAADRTALVETLHAEGLELPADFGPDSAYDASLSVAVHAFLARTRAALAGVQLEDLIEERDLVNLPGRTDGYPSWRRRYAVPIETLEAQPLVAVLAALMQEIRPPLGPS